METKLSEARLEGNSQKEHKLGEFITAREQQEKGRERNVDRNDA